VSTRSVDELGRATGMTGISKSQVGRLHGEIDGKIAALLDRPLGRGLWGIPGGSQRCQSLGCGQKSSSM